jgi:hypothetical protein
MPGLILLITASGDTAEARQLPGDIVSMGTPPFMSRVFNRAENLSVF